MEESRKMPVIEQHVLNRHGEEVVYQKHTGPNRKDRRAAKYHRGSLEDLLKRLQRGRKLVTKNTAAPEPVLSEHGSPEPVSDRERPDIEPRPA